jgi:hypothetical protein
LPNCWRPIFLVLLKLHGCQVDLPNCWSCSKQRNSVNPFCCQYELRLWSSKWIKLFDQSKWWSHGKFNVMEIGSPNDTNWQQYCQTLLLKCEKTFDMLWT